jgi:hypothetical protein
MGSGSKLSSTLLGRDERQKRQWQDGRVRGCRADLGRSHCLRGLGRSRQCLGWRPVREANVPGPSRRRSPRLKKRDKAFAGWRHVSRSHTKAHVSTSFPHVFGGSGEFCFHMFSECLSFSSTCAGLQDRSCLGFPVKGLLFFVLCNRHWFNKAPGPDPENG